MYPRCPKCGERHACVVCPKCGWKGEEMKFDGDNTEKPTGIDHCKTCRFWRRYSRPAVNNFGECRKSHPVILPDGATSFPETHELEWCGEYEPKEAR